MTRSILFLVVFIYSTVLNAAIYYVDQGHPSASDSNTGTETAPWKTIQKAANTLVAGDKVWVKAGIYTELSSAEPNTSVTALKPRNSGSAGNEIVYEAFPGDIVVLDQKKSGIGFYIYGLSFIRVSGFEVRNTWGSALYTRNGASDITFEYNYIHNIDGQTGSNVGGIRFDQVVRPTARNNTIHTIRVGGVTNGNAACIHSYGMEDALIENNNLSDAYNGVYHKLSTGRIGAMIRRNVIHNVKLGIYYDVQGGGSPGHVNQRATQNVIYNSERGVYLRAKNASPSNDGFYVWNNVIDTSLYGVIFDNAKNVDIYNNVIIGPLSKQAIASRSKVISINRIDYNAYFNSDYFVMDQYGSSQVNYSSLSSWQSGEGFDTNSIMGDPLFVDRALNDYRLTNSSPLIGAGMNGENIGAYLTGNEVIGTYFTRPTAPTSLAAVR